jgi:hypothetical protein
MKQLLPAELWAFLTNGGQFTCDPEALETGWVKLHPAADLRIGRVYIAPHSDRDPNYEESGIYRVPAISLVESCERYAPDHLLTYLPFEQAFAAFDADHARVTVFPEASWTDILEGPHQYLNALWQSSPEVPVLREDTWWQRYVFFKDAFE